MKIKYHDPSGHPVIISVPVDVVAVEIDKQDDPDFPLPALEVTVNTDAVLVHTQNGDKRLGGLEYTDLLDMLE